MRRVRRLLVCCALVTGGLLAESVHAYDPDLHQQFTFIAAKQLNRCLEGSSLPRLTPLQVRYIAKSDVAQAQGSWFGQFRWGYYDRAAQNQRKLLWVIDTRLHDHFKQLETEMTSAREMGDQYSDLGYITNYLQNMTSPAHVVPVYFTRWWRLSFSDRFDGYPIDEAAVEDEFIFTTYCYLVKYLEVRIVCPARAKRVQAVSRCGASSLGTRGSDVALRSGH